MTVVGQAACRTVSLVLLAVALAGLLVGIVATPAIAHPLGNTSVNIYERIELGGTDIRVHFVMDVSELPALDEQRFADTDDDGTVDEDEAATYLDGFWGYLEPRLQLRVGSTVVKLERTDEAMSFPPGQGGLTLMRVVFELVGAHPATEAGTVLEASLTETTFEGVPGWHEIIVRASPGATLVRSDVPEEDLTDELRSYPEDRLTTPLSVRVASFAYSLEAPVAATPAPATSGGPVAATPAPSARPVPARPADPLVALLTPGIGGTAAALAMLVALGLGAVHAISPGHGKTLVAAYVLGTRASVRQALWLGLTVAITHTAGVFVLGLGTWFASEWFAPERLVSWLAVVTGVLVVGLGALLVWRARRHRQPHDHGHTHARGHAQDHGHTHDHPHVPAAPSPTLRTRDVAALGIVGGLVPSGSALILLLSSIALGEVAFGIVLIVAFGLGMAVVLIGIATGVVLLRRSPRLGLERASHPNIRRLAAALPVLSGLAVVALGVVLTAEAVRNLR
jgi:ABC-type nickel/cobalt efflux system permease component RcnA